MRKFIQTTKDGDAVSASPSAKLLSTALLSLCLSTTMLANANAGERESLEQLRATTVNLVKLLVQEGVLSKDKAEALLKQAEKDAEKAKQLDATVTAQTKDAVDATVSEKMVRVQYVPEHIKNEMREEIEMKVMSKLHYKAEERLGIPDWIDRLHWEGDLRLRYQGDRFGDGNPVALNFNANNQTDTKNTTEDRDRARVRARLGVKAEVNDWMKAGIRITTGDLTDPVSPNQTQETASAKYTIGLDRAYVTAQIKPWLSITGGRFENPWFSTDLVWDPDLAFDGIAASFTSGIYENLSSFVTVGAFPIDEIEKSAINKTQSKWLYGGQAGVKWVAPNKSTVKLGVALYEFDNIEGQQNGAVFNPGPYDATAPAYHTKGNSLFDINSGSGTPVYALASQFRELNLTGEVDVASFDPVHVILTGDYVRNIGYDKSEIAERTGLISALLPKEDVDAYQLKLAVGMPNMKKGKDWQAYVAYKYLGADSILDGFTDSDFYLGGTNAKGWVLGGSYGLDKNAWITARWFSAEEIAPRGSLDPLSIDVLMLDLNTKF
ncbi:MAG: putative porin [Methylophilus sp.]|nr:putative porin [Methylophilus sp.]